MKVAIVGSRDYANLAAVRQFVQCLSPDTVIVSGGAVGVDREAELAARERGLPEPIIFPIDRSDLPPWPAGREEFTRRAYARNRRIVDEADELVAFWNGISGGTKYTIDYARKVGKIVDVRGADGEALL